jgi:glycosyltransferase involved in cell wall biosynthesis
MKISVVISTYNRRATLQRTLPTVLAQDFASGQREVVVVVDGSIDATGQYLRGMLSPCKLTVVEQSNHGPAAARNAGIRAAAGEIILLLDDDMLCGPGFLAGHIATHQQAGPQLVYGPVRAAAGSPDSVARSWFYRAQDSSRRREAGSSAQSKYRVWATNCSVPRSVLLAAGGYDESFRTHEDADLAIRLSDAGVHFKFQPALVLEELYDKSPSNLVKAEARGMGRDEVRLCRKHPGYRPFSRPAHLSNSPLGPLFMRLAGCLRASPEPLLRPMQAIAQRIPGGWAQALARQCFGARLAIEEVRGMVEECGSWQAFVDCFGAGGRIRPGADGTRCAGAGGQDTTIPTRDCIAE